MDSFKLGTRDTMFPSITNINCDISSRTTAAHLDNTSVKDVTSNETPLKSIH